MVDGYGYCLVIIVVWPEGLCVETVKFNTLGKEGGGGMGPWFPPPGSAPALEPTNSLIVDTLVSSNSEETDGPVNICDHVADSEVGDIGLDSTFFCLQLREFWHSSIC